MNIVKKLTKPRVKSNGRYYNVAKLTLMIYIKNLLSNGTYGN